MRIAILSDVHVNLTALDAVIADIGAMSPDVVLHGCDLADGGASPVEVVDRIRELGWDGVLATLGLPALVYAETITANTTNVKAIPINELRGGVK